MSCLGWYVLVYIIFSFRLGFSSLFFFHHELCVCVCCLPACLPACRILHICITWSWFVFLFMSIDSIHYSFLRYVCECVSTGILRARPSLDHIIAFIQFEMNIESKLNYFMGLFTCSHQRDYFRFGWRRKFSLNTHVRKQLVDFEDTYSHLFGTNS